MPVASLVRWIGILALGTHLAAAPAEAWDLYVRGDLGISVDRAETDGDANGFFQGLGFSGDDVDDSPVGGGAFGVDIPLNQLLPWDVRLPPFDLRMEIEALSGRDAEWLTKTSAGSRVFSEVKQHWTLMGNFWLDLPVQPIHKPLQMVFGRMPRLRRALEPISWYLGAGVGVAGSEIKVVEESLSGKDTDYKFAWQVGSGFGYDLTERVTLSMGYRYVDFDDQEIDVKNVGNSVGSFEVDRETHEFTAQIRIKFYKLPYPWR